MLTLCPVNLCITPHVSPDVVLVGAQIRMLRNMVPHMAIISDHSVPKIIPQKLNSKSRILKVLQFSEFDKVEIG